jgi:hypothetical protein
MQEAIPSMAQAWIEQLADNIKQKNHEAAEDYGRAQHYTGIIATRGKEFFVALVLSLQEKVESLRTRLQGDLTSSETRVQTTRADEVKIARARFPWIDARLTHREATITLDYVKGPGLEGDPKLDRKTSSFAFQVGPGDTLYVEDTFPSPDTAPPNRYPTPADLARHITEILFAA